MVIFFAIAIPLIVVLVGNFLAISIGDEISNFGNSIEAQKYLENLELRNRQNELTKWNSKNETLRNDKTSKF